MRKRASFLRFGLIFITVSPFFTASAFAFGLEKCGEYEAEAFVSAPKNEKSVPGDPVLIIERKSESETELTFPSIESNTLRKYIGTHLRVRFQIKMPCFGKCKANLIKVIRPLEPYQKPANFFFPRPEPKPSIPCGK